MLNNLLIFYPWFLLDLDRLRLFLISPRIHEWFWMLDRAQISLDQPLTNIRRAAHGSQFRPIRSIVVSRLVPKCLQHVQAGMDHALLLWMPKLRHVAELKIHEEVIINWSESFSHSPFLIYLVDEDVVQFFLNTLSYWYECLPDRRVTAIGQSDATPPHSNCYSLI